MTSIDINDLEYLHDAIVAAITFVHTAESKELRITVRCDDDCGYADWAGKVLTVRILDAIRVSGVLLGHVAGYDVVNSFTEGSSPDMQRAITELGDIGITPPKRLLRLTLQSGSELEIACHAIAIEIGWPTGTG